MTNSLQSKIQLKIKKTHIDAVIPKYATAGSAGFDLVAVEDVEILSGCTALVNIGLSFEIPEGYEMQIRPRSGVSLKTRLRVANSPGTIDSDFRGTVMVIIDNTTVNEENPFSSVIINKGDRIAQGVICPVMQAEFLESDLTRTNRDQGGFGSTGIK